MFVCVFKPRQYQEEMHYILKHVLDHYIKYQKVQSVEQ